MTHRQLRIRFTLMQFLLWLTFGTFGIFYVAQLKGMGYSAAFIAFGLTISTTAGIFAQYFWGYISDLTSAIRTIFLCLLAAMMAVVAFFPVAVQRPQTALLIMVLFGMTWMPLEALLDSWILSTDGLPHSDYGSIRSGGSFGFSVITVFFGGVIARFGFNVAIIAFILCGTLLLITAFLTKPHTSKTPTPMGLDQVKRLLSNKQYVGILIFSILIFVNHMGINNFYIYVVRGVGGDEGLIGLAAAAAASTEIFGFYLGGKLKGRVNPLLIMIVVAVGSLARVIFLSISVTAFGVIVTAVLQGLMFSLFLGTFKVLISEITPVALLASAQTVAASTYFGIASIIANILGGLLIDDYGMSWFYKVMAFISAAAVIYVIGLYLAQRRQKTV